jgi:hypothetical protein
MLAFLQYLGQVYEQLGFGIRALLVIAMFVLTSGTGIALILWLPRDHFTRTTAADSWWRRRRALRWTGMIIRNALGLVILPLGIALSLPFVPGPGLVLILIGFSLLDFPGKEKLERRLLGRPSVRRFLDDVRQRFGKPPFDVASP